MKNKKLISRLIVSPFILGILTISYTIGLVKQFIGYIRYGGEWVTYYKDDKDTIRNMIDLFKSSPKNDETNKLLEEIIRLQKHQIDNDCEPHSNKKRAR